jgi:hypothetical protein
VTLSEAIRLFAGGGIGGDGATESGGDHDQRTDVQASLVEIFDELADGAVDLALISIMRVRPFSCMSQPLNGPY